MDRQDTGILLNPTNIKLQRTYFNQMVKLLGIQAQYRAPREDKHYNGYGELNSFYYEPEIVGCIFEEHVSNKTAKLLGWNSEQVESTPVIHVPYDTNNLQVGSIFILPSGIDDAKSRMFRVLELSTIAIYPASVACSLGPLLVNESQKAELDYSDSNFNLLSDDDSEDEDYI